MHNFEKNGFTLISEDEIPSYSSKGYLLRHKSGFEVYWLKNDDKERFFSYTIYTPPFDNSGVFHILEHTLLTGSERYKVRDPFMGMIRNSCNTFLNAMTGPDRTYFPAASPVKKDFDNIFKVYTDALFAPLLRRESFMQEGIRISSKNGMHFEGVVFSEMQGDISQHESVVSAASTRPLFDDASPYRYEFGGNPPDIPTLTYEKFIETYKKHYVPANMTLFLYGDLELDEYLDFLNREYLEERDPGKRIERTQLTSAWDSPRKYKDYSSGDESAVMVSWLLERAEDKRFATMLSLIVDILLGNPGSPLYKAITDSGLGKDLSSESGLSDSYREFIFSAGLVGAKENDAAKIEEYIVESLKSIADKGLDKKAVNAAIRRMEFKIKEIPSGLPQGYRLFFTHIDKGWAYGRSPSDMLRSVETIDEIKRENEENPRLFEDWILNNLVNNKHRLLSVVMPSEEGDGMMAKKIESRLQELKGTYREEDEKRFDEFEEIEDSLEAIATLPRLSSSDIPNERNDIAHIEDGRIIYNRFTTGGIVYFDISFDISDLSLGELEDAEVLSRLMGMCDVGNLSYSDFLTELNYSTGGVSFSVDAGTDCNGELKVYFIMRIKLLDEYVKEAFKLLAMLIKELRVDSKERIRATLVDIESGYQSSVLRSGHTFAISLAEASLSDSLYLQEKLQGLSFWFRVRAMMSEIDELPSRLSSLMNRIFTESRITFHAAFEEKSEKDVLKEIKAFIDSLRKDDCKKFISSIKRDAIDVLYSAKTPVSYSALAALSATFGTIEHAKEKLFLSITGSNEIWALIREKGGAYGGGALVDSNEDVMVFYTYRDPRLKESLDDFVKAVKEQVLNEANIEDARLAVLSRDVRPLSPSVKAYMDFKRYLYKISDEERFKNKTMMLTLTKDEIEGVRGEILKALEHSSIGAIASESAIKSLGERVKKLPL